MVGKNEENANAFEKAAFNLMGYGEGKRSDHLVVRT